MQKDIGFLETKRGKIALGFLSFSLFALVFQKATHFYIRSRIPEVVQLSIDSAKTSKKVLSKTGQIFSEQYSFNEFARTKDSLGFDIKLKGEKAMVTIKGEAVKQDSDKWRIYKSDITFVTN